MKATILAIGTELTTGQIINRNASTISERLKPFGIAVTAHLTVPDNKKLILEALQFLQNKSDLIFITGGLGPTSDDFTRDVVAEWSQLKMNFHEQTWIYIQERLSSRGFTVRDMQKQQCYFPEGSEILVNREGTAHGFTFQAFGKDVFVLPGPPREIDAIWKDHLDNLLQNKTQGLDKVITKAWDTIGVGESEVAFQVEEVLTHRPRDLDLEIGYRVHLPYVEVKLTFNEKDLSRCQHFIALVDKQLAPMTVSRDFEDVSRLVPTKLRNTDFTFYDFVSGGHLQHRLSSHLKSMKRWSFKQSDEPPSPDFFEGEDHFLALLPYENNMCVIVFSTNGQLNQKIIEAPMKSPLMEERRRQYFAEMALIELNRLLPDLK